MKKRAGATDGNLTRIEHLGRTVWNIPLNYPHPRHYDAFASVFRLENTLRLLVFLRLKAGRGGGWLDSPVRNGSSKTLRSIFRQRYETARTHGYIGRMSQVPMMYLDLGDLIDLITHDANRPLFSRTFRSSLTVLRPKLEEVRAIRNNLAHFREVSEDDIKILEQIWRQLGPDILRNLLEVTDSRSYKTCRNGQDPWIDNIRGHFEEANRSPAKLNIGVGRSGEWLSLEFSLPYVISRKWHDSGKSGWTICMYTLNHGAAWKSLRRHADAVVAYESRAWLEPEGDASGNFARFNPELNPSICFYVARTRAKDCLKAMVSRLCTLAQEIEKEQVSAELEDLNDYIFLVRHVQSFSRDDVQRGELLTINLAKGNPDIPEDWTGLSLWWRESEPYQLPWLTTRVQSGWLSGPVRVPKVTIPGT